MTEVGDELESTIAFVLLCLFAGAVDVEEVRRWADHVIDSSRTGDIGLGPAGWTPTRGSASAHENRHWMPRSCDRGRCVT